MSFKQKKKVLVIRFNSIGDIVLTSPVVDALHRSGLEVHYLVKRSYSTLLENNSRITKIWLYQDKRKELIKALKNETFDYIVDLHNNLRSLIFRWHLRRPSFTLNKNRVNDLLISRFNFAKKQREHIVLRFLKTVEPLTGKVFHPEPGFYFSDNKQYSDIRLHFESFICIAVGTAFPTKDIPKDKLIELMSRINENIVLLGGADEKTKAKQIIDALPDKVIVDLTGSLTIDQSAYLVSKSKMLLCGDTGLMHIAAALDISTLSVFGSTHPILGYTPFYVNESTPRSIVQLEDLPCRPCTKQGRTSCPKGHFKCMKAISVDEMHTKVEGILKS